VGFTVGGGVTVTGKTSIIVGAGVVGARDGGRDGAAVSSIAQMKSDKVPITARFLNCFTW